MKERNSLLGALILGASLFAADPASAFPLYLTAASGTISFTPSYSALAHTNVAKIGTVAVNLKTLMTVVSNQVFVKSSLHVPKDAQIAYDPYLNSSDQTYLTNKSGFYYNVLTNGIVNVWLHDIATGFRVTNGAVSENDTILVMLDVRGEAPDGFWFVFTTYGRGSLLFSTDKNNKGSMTMSLSNGSTWGQYKASDDGVSSGSFTLTGKGTPEWAGPFSTRWWLHH